LVIVTYPVIVSDSRDYRFTAGQLARIDLVRLDMDGILLDLAYDNYFWVGLISEKYAVLAAGDTSLARERLFDLYRSAAGSLSCYCLNHWTRPTCRAIRRLKLAASALDWLSAGGHRNFARITFVWRDDANRDQCSSGRTRNKFAPDWPQPVRRYPYLMTRIWRREVAARFLGLTGVGGSVRTGSNLAGRHRAPMVIRKTIRLGQYSGDSQTGCPHWPPRRRYRGSSRRNRRHRVFMA
jgi:hypothetical protein